MEKPIYDALSKMLPADSHIRIAGGEPLLVFDNWKKWIRGWKGVEVLSNFRFIPDGYYDLPVRTSVSIDGCGEKPLDKEIVRNVSGLKMPWIMTTIIDTSPLPLLAEYVSKNGYGWALSTDYWWNGTPSVEELIVAMSDVIWVLKENNYDFKQFSFNNIDTAGRGGCCAGDEMFAVYCDGNIYQCQTLLHDKPIGNVYDGYTKSPCKKVCPDCSAKGLCTGWCPLYHKPGRMCEVLKYVALEVAYAK